MCADRPDLTDGQADKVICRGRLLGWPLLQLCKHKTHSWNWNLVRYISIRELRMLFIQLYLNHPINPGFVLNIRNNIDIICLEKAKYCRRRLKLSSPIESIVDLYGKVSERRFYVDGRLLVPHRWCRLLHFGRPGGEIRLSFGYQRFAGFSHPSNFRVDRILDN